MQDVITRKMELTQNLISSSYFIYTSMYGKGINQIQPVSFPNAKHFDYLHIVTEEKRPSALDTIIFSLNSNKYGFYTYSKLKEMMIIATDLCIW